MESTMQRSSNAIPRPHAGTCGKSGIAAGTNVLPSAFSGFAAVNPDALDRGGFRIAFTGC